ncbi:MAG: hypothetical protein R2815_10120 [Flavobacteriales bacterium]
MARLHLSALTASMVLFATTLHAQGLFDLGLKGGVNMDDLATSYAHESVLGGHAGIFARVKPPLLPGAQGEVLLTTLGTRVTVEGETLELRTAAVQAPVFAVFSLGPVELHGGGYYERYLTDNLADELDLGLEGETIELTDLAQDGFGLLVGGGLHLGHFYAGARYNIGMDPIGSGPYLSDVRSRQVQVYLGLGFAGKAK